MTVESAQGIVLRVRPLGDTSVIVHWLTAEQGRVATVAKGARGAKSAFAGKLDLCYEAEFSFRRSRSGELHGLAEVSITNTHAAMSRDLETLQILAHAVASIEQVTEPDTPQPEVYDLFGELLLFLEKHGPMPRALFAWDLRFLRTQGLEPDPASKALGEAARQLIADLLAGEWDDLALLKPDNKAVGQMRRFLEGFWIHHFGRLPDDRTSTKVPVLREKKPSRPPAGS